MRAGVWVCKCMILNTLVGNCSKGFRVLLFACELGCCQELHGLRAWPRETALLPEQLGGKKERRRHNENVSCVLCAAS